MTSTVAIVAHSRRAYSETFIQAHRSLPGFATRYYYGGLPPLFCEETGSILKLPPVHLCRYGLLRMFMSHPPSLREYALVRSFYRENIKAVIAEFGPVGATVRSVCEHARLPLIVFFYGYDVSVHSVIDQYRERYQELFSYSRYLIGVSNSIRKALIELGCPKDKILVQRCSPDKEFFQVNPTFKYSRIFANGRFVDKKAPYYLVLMMEKILKRRPESILRISGDGPLLQVCQHLAQYLGIANSIHFCGVLSRTQIIEELAQASVFIQHSVVADTGDMEGLPVAILEASAAALPVVATNHSGINEGVIDGETGYLVAEKDLEGMATMVMRLLEDPQLAKEMGLKGRQYMSEHFCIDARRHFLSELLRSVVQ
jgi:colanic acid/amylovoran biosynthesis glycosyltransferase